MAARKASKVPCLIGHKRTEAGISPRDRRRCPGPAETREFRRANAAPAPAPSFWPNGPSRRSVYA